MLKVSQDRAPEKRTQVRRRTVSASLTLLASLSTQGCLFQQKKATAPAPVRPIIVVKIAPPRVMAIPSSDLTPPLEIAVLAEPEPLNSDAIFPPPPVRTVPPKAAPSKTATAPEPAPAPTPQTPRAIITAEERNRMETELKNRLDHVRTVLQRTEGKILAGDLAALANNARTFAAQAEQERQGDLPTAVSLATRADRFATDLSARLP